MNYGIYKTTVNIHQENLKALKLLKTFVNVMDLNIKRVRSAMANER